MHVRRVVKHRGTKAQSFFLSFILCASVSLCSILYFPDFYVLKPDKGIAVLTLQADEAFGG